MNTIDLTAPTSTAPPRRRSRPMQAVALTTVATFLAATVGCADRGTGPDTESDEISIRSQVYKDGTYHEAFTETMPLAEVPAWDRTIEIDGVARQDLQGLRSASVVTLDLNNDRTLTLRAVAEGVFTIEGASSRNGEPLLTALRLTDDAVEFYVNGNDWRANPADLVVNIDGIGDELLVQTLDKLALYALLASVEDHPQIAWAAVVLILGAGWLAICGYSLNSCSNRCEKCAGYDFQCFGFTLKQKNGDYEVEVGGSAGCTCIQPCKES
jgi:hypothetical protein